MLSLATARRLLLLRFNTERIKSETCFGAQKFKEGHENLGGGSRKISVKKGVTKIIKIKRL